MPDSSQRLTGSTWDVEHLLSDALRPIEPPERLSGRFEDTLAAVTQAAAEELSDWAEELSESELRALRDPRNWVRPVVALGAGSAAAADASRQRAACARWPAGSGRSRAPPARRRRGKRGGDPQRAERQVQQVDARVHRDQAEDRRAAAQGEAPEGERHVGGAQA